MIKKLKNKKGFAMAELLAVSMVVLILFSILFSNYLPLVAEYENRLSYNDVTAQYAAHYISKIYDEAMYSSDGQISSLEDAISKKEKGFFIVYKDGSFNDATSSFDETKTKYIKKIIEEYKIKEIIITTYNTTKAKKNYDQNSGALYNYIKYLPKYENAVYGKDSDHPEIYRVILKTDYGYATTSIKTSSCKVDVIEKDNSGANAPVLDDNMIPVYYDNCDGEWKVADTENGNWYNYSQKIWANSVTVKNLTRAKYITEGNYNIGIPVLMDDILTMQVWIPRYKYKVWNYNADGTKTSNPQEIEITWEDGTSKTGEITCQDAISGTDGSASETCKLKSTNATCTDSTCNNKTYTHPAFTFGDDELTGFWMGKFEVSTSEMDDCYKSIEESGKQKNCNKTGIEPLVKPNVMSYRNASVSTFETNIMAMNGNNNIYGLNTTTDTHMIKNSEWGAVAYLSHSKYGTCTDGTCREVFINNSEDHYTGRSGGNVSGSTPINGTYTDKTLTTQYNTYGYYTYDGYLLNYNTNKKSTTKDISKVASTTGNIYGVYDMSGGSREYTMSNVVNNDDSTMILEAVKFESFPYDKYIDKYKTGELRLEIYRSKLGDGIKELYNKNQKIKFAWYGDEASVAFYASPWFFRGGNSKVDSDRTEDSPNTIGIFASSYYTGAPNDTYSTRAIIVPNKAMVTQEN